MHTDPVAVALKFGFLAVLYLFLVWVAWSALRDVAGRRRGGAIAGGDGGRGNGELPPALRPRLEVVAAMGHEPGTVFELDGEATLGRAKSAVLIPRNAVFVTDRGPVAYRRGTFAVTAIPLTLGRENEKSVEVLSGLSVSDRVLVPKTADKEQAKS